MNQVDIANAAIELAHKELWEAQLKHWPGSTRLKLYDMLKMLENLPLRQQTTFLLTLSLVLQYPAHVFYRTAEGDIGCRFGLEGHEYISGFTT